MRKYLFLILLMPWIRFISAQHIVSFADVSYQDITIQGTQGSAMFYFRIPPQSSGGEGNMTLRLIPSQALNLKNSFVTILFNDEPVESVPLTGDTLVLKMHFPVKKQNASTFLKLGVHTDLSITGNICKDLFAGSLWLKVSAESTFQLPPNVPSQTRSLAQEYEKMNTIVIPDKATLSETGDASFIYAAMLQRRQPGAIIYTQSSKPDSIHDYIWVGTISQLPTALDHALPVQPVAGVGLLSLVQEPGTVKDSADEIVSTVLVATGADDTSLSKAVNVLLDEAVVRSSFGSYLTISRAVPPPRFSAFANAPYISLRSLGANTEIIRGIGSLNNLYNFQMSDFNTDPGDIDLKVEARYSGLMPNSTERGYCNILLNGKLLQTKALDGSGLIQNQVRMSGFYLRKYNVLNIQFIYYPAQEACVSGISTFYEQIDIDHSFLHPANTASKLEQLNFSQFPQVFYNHPLDAVIGLGASQNTATVLGELIYELNGSSVQPMRFPEIFSAAKYPIARMHSHAVIALLDPTDPMVGYFSGIPVKINRNFRLYNGLNNQPLYQVSDSVSAAIAQIFYQDHALPVMLLTAASSSSVKTLSGITAIIGSNTPFLNSNVIETGNGQHYFFNIIPGSNLVAYLGETTRFQQFWSSYYLFVLAFLLLLILLLFIYVKSKVKQSRSLFEAKPADE